MEKICKKCGRLLPIDSYYVHNEMLDGHLNICKDCVKERVNKHRSDNIDKIREYDRGRAHQKHRQKLRTEITYKRRHEVEGYEKSHNAIYRAIEKGELQRSNTCQVCGKQGKTEAHHNDYHKTKKVLWLCPACHKIYHLGKGEKADSIRQIIDLMLKMSAS